MILFPRHDIRLFSIILFLNLFYIPSAHAKTKTQDQVVKIFVTSNSMDYYRPWQSNGVTNSSGSGAIIRGKRILTNAHVVTDQTFIQVKKNNNPRKFTATLEAISHDCDLAILKVNDESFFDGTEPLLLGDLPQLQDTVSVIGYPQGGDKISITEGVVSRLELTPYSQTGRTLLTVQIDAAINPGNSGGPVIQNGKLVGIAMQVLQSGQNIGYMIPVPIIKHLFEDLEDKNYDGFPMLGIDYSTTENITLREFYGISKEAGGVLVNNIAPFSPADNILQKGDIILKIDDVPIGEDGTFEFREEERLSLPFLITDKQIGETIDLTIKRDHKTEHLKLELIAYEPLIPHPQHFKKPTYYIYGGLVFTVLSTDLLKTWGGRWWEKSPIDMSYYLWGAGRLNPEGQREIVVALNVLSDDINVGYEDISNNVVNTVNGVHFKSFKEFVQLLNQNKKSSKYTIIETKYGHQVILDNSEIDMIDEKIIKRNNIPGRYSEDVASWLKEE